MSMLEAFEHACLLPVVLCEEVQVVGVVAIAGGGGVVMMVSGRQEPLPIEGVNV